ncbi:hypothetical protein AMTR_s00057p00055480 [Amborella trichopoda]|uniref:NAD-dependent epimerase/dehydratase domain-containing protein n=1 Tax=Amborella trichopoda TaxID=13333 RepID=U5D3E7_AMBTC|nr:hypothetical protein AMTR_s00057p00055480 [Amborella trichopoda]
MVGLSLVEALSKASSRSTPSSWKVYAVARRPKPRPSIIIGASSRSKYNALLTWVAYALICKQENEPFRFPGRKYSWDHFCDVSDADLLAEQQIWASTTDKAKNEAFNCSNGDVFTWKSMWKELARVMSVPYVPFSGESFDISKAMSDKGRLWDDIVSENGLCETKLEENATLNLLTCFFNLSVTV